MCSGEKREDEEKEEARRAVDGSGGCGGRPRRRVAEGRRGWNRRLVGYVLAGALAAAERGLAAYLNPYEEMCVRRRESHFVIIAMTYRSYGLTDGETLHVSQSGLKNI